MRFILSVALVVITLTPPLAWGRQVPADLDGHWAEAEIDLLVRRNIIQLFHDPTFRPFDEISRAEFIQWLVTATGLPPRPVRTPSFADVPVSHPLSPYIESAYSYGLIPHTPAFFPSTSITRSDAIVLAVQALRYGFETFAMADRVLPFEDTDGLPAQVRGAVAVAVSADPPLLREPSSPLLRPYAPMTRGEAASLVGTTLLAVERGIVLRSTSSIAAGVDLTVEKRGALRTLPVWRVQIGAFSSEENVQLLAASIRDRGLPVFVDLLDESYKVSVGNFATAAEAALLKDQLAAEGFPALVIHTLRDFENLSGPFRAASLVIDPSIGATLVPAFGDGQRMHRQRTSDLARRAGAVAAVNGGFFSATGNPLGCLVVRGEVQSEPGPLRTCAGITEDGTVLFDQVQFEATVTSGDQIAWIDGVNRDRRTDEMILYRPAFDLTTRTNQHGAEAIVTGDVVDAVVDLRGNSPIPRDGFVLSGHGRARSWILQALQPGTRIALAIRLAPASGDSRWDRVLHAVGGGPRLLVGGQFVGIEGVARTVSEHRHPRTAIGMLADGRILLLVVDGRQPYHSLGMTLFELAMELRRLGAVEAMNLDGGGSTTLVVSGRVVNLPSDETGERAVADALLVLSSTQSSR